MLDDWNGIPPALVAALADGRDEEGARRFGHTQEFGTGPEGLRSRSVVIARPDGWALVAA
jgi:hypothetical protein